jgi:hypothetical protein
MELFIILAFYWTLRQFATDDDISSLPASFLATLLLHLSQYPTRNHAVVLAALVGQYAGSKIRHLHLLVTAARLNNSMVQGIEWQGSREKTKPNVINHFLIVILYSAPQDSSPRPMAAKRVRHCGMIMQVQWSLQRPRCSASGCKPSRSLFPKIKELFWCSQTKRTHLMSVVIYWKEGNLF